MNVPYRLMNHYVASLLVAAMVILGIYLSAGFYLETYERMIASVLYGNTCSPPYYSWFNEGLFLQPPILSRLSDWFPEIPIYGVWHIILLVLSLSLVLHLSNRVIARVVKNTPMRFLAALLLAMALVSFGMVYANVTKYSILLSAISILLYADYWIYEKKQNKWLLLTFFLGCSLRVSSASLVVICLSVFFLVYYRNIKHTFTLLKFQWLIVGVCLLVVTLYKRYTDNVGLKIEQNYEYAFCDRHAMVPLSQMKTLEDSIRYRAVSEHFLVMDSAQVDIQFLDRLVDKEKYLALGINGEDMHHLKEALVPLLQQYCLELVLLYILLGIALWGNGWEIRFRVLSLHFIGWLIVIGLSMKINMFDHFLLPWMGILFIGSAWLSLTEDNQFKPVPKTIALIVLSSLLFLSFREMKSTHDYELTYNQNSQAYMAQIRHLSAEKTLIIWFDQGDYLPTRILNRKESEPLRKSIYMSMYFLMYQFGQDRCVERFGFSPLNFVEMNKELTENRENLYFLVEELTAEFLKTYYKVIYGLEFNLVKTSPEREVVPDVFIYTLELEE